MLKHDLTPEEFEARLTEFAGQLLGWPVKGEAYKKDDGDEWETWATPPITELTDEQIELAGAFLQPENYKRLTGQTTAPVYASDSVWLWVLEQTKEIQAIWKTLLDDGEFWRPDYLIATLVQAFDAHIEGVCTELHWNVFDPRGDLHSEFSRRSRSIRRQLPDHSQKRDNPLSIFASYGGAALSQENDDIEPQFGVSFYLAL